MTGPATLIVSPLASRIRREDVRRDVTSATIRALARRGLSDVHVIEAGDPADIREAAASAIGAGAPVVVVAGGDGTVRDAAGVLAGSGIPVGIVPCGTGNLYASATGVPRDLERAIAAIAEGEPRPYDVGEVRFIEAARPAGADDGADAAPGGSTRRLVGRPLTPGTPHSWSRAGPDSMLPSSRQRPVNPSGATEWPRTSLPRAACLATSGRGQR